MFISEVQKWTFEIIFNRMWKVDFQSRKHSAPINQIDVSLDMNYVASASNDRMVGLTNLISRQTQMLAGHNNSVNCVSFSPLSNRVITGAHDGQMILWDVQNAEKLHELQAHQLTIRSVCWSPDGRFLCTGSNDSTVGVWSLNHFTKRATLTGLKGWVRDVKWSGNMIIVAGNDSKILLFDDRTNKPFQTINTGTTSDVNSISIHRNQQCIAAGLTDQIIRVWDIRTSSLLQKHSAHGGPISQVAFNPSNDELLSCSRDGLTKLWDFQTSKVLATFDKHKGAVLGCCWIPTCRGFMTCGEDRKVISYKFEPKPIDPTTLEYDGGDFIEALEKMQSQINSLATTMKSLDKRLLIQEEKLQWLADIDEPISNAASSN